MNNSLQKLKDNKTSILLAEIGAYLHDLGKARKGFIEHYAQNGGSGWDGHNFPSNFPNELKDLLSQTKVQICNEQVCVMDFIEKHHKEKEGHGVLNDCDIPSLIRLLYAGWNGYDGMDSGLDKGRANVKQSRDNVFIANAFGYEPKENKIETKDADKPKNLYDTVKDALKAYSTNNDIIKLRATIINGTKNHFLKFLGETRRPANDVTLWDHSYSVATLFKCAVAKNILDCPLASFDPLDFSWKILSINLDTLSIINKGIKVSDVLEYKEKINEALDKIKAFIEKDCPLGNEIYRDTNGAFFLIPNIEIEELKTEILNKLRDIEPELMPKITIKEIEANQPNSYKFDCKNQQQIPSHIKSQRREFENNKKKGLLEILPKARQIVHQEIVYPTSSERFFSEKFAQNWSNKEVCPICYLQPMEENTDGCEYCLKRRKEGGRAKSWIENPQHTIWLDEVSDHNDKVALLIGCFILDKWLDGSLIKTMTMTNKPPIPKNPSPARIRRCWETIQEFINFTIFENILSRYHYGNGSPFIELRKKRIQFTINPNPNISRAVTCDINIDGLRLSPVCIDATQGLFITTTNLQLLSNKGETITEIASWIQGKNIKVKIGTGNKWQEGFKISGAKPADTKFHNYLPYVKIYDFPDQFMALVPAYDALDIAKKIAEEYKIQFSKVRDRLPLHLGIITFHRRTTLYVVMDGAKRLIKAFNDKSNTITTEINDIKNNNKEKGIEFLVQTDDYSKKFEWNISYATGDPNIEDLWHPYFRLDGNTNLNNRELSFDYTGRNNFVIHVKELQKGDKILIEPSYFKAVFLNNSADRFHIDENLLFLDDIRQLDELWNDILKIVEKKDLGNSQIYDYWHEVIKKPYKDYKGDLFWEAFLKSSLINILQLSPEKDRELFDKLFQSTKDSLLDFCLHWNLQVRKINLEKQEVKI